MICTSRTTGMRSTNAVGMGASIGFDAKERGRVIRVRVGIDGQLWTWRDLEDYRQGRCTTYGQDTVASCGIDAMEYCQGFGVRNEETDRVLSMLTARAHKELARG